MQKVKRAWLYAGGILPFFLAYQPLKALIPGPALLIVALGYFVMCRLVADRFGK